MNVEPLSKLNPRLFMKKTLLVFLFAFFSRAVMSNQKLEEKEARIAALEKELGELKRMLTKSSPEGIKP